MRSTASRSDPARPTLNQPHPPRGRRECDRRRSATAGQPARKVSAASPANRVSRQRRRATRLALNGRFRRPSLTSGLATGPTGSPFPRISGLGAAWWRHRRRGQRLRRPIRANRVFRGAGDKLRREMNAGLHGGGRARTAAVRRRRKPEWAAAIRATPPLLSRNRGLGGRLERGVVGLRGPNERVRARSAVGAGRLLCARVRGGGVRGWW